MIGGNDRCIRGSSRGDPGLGCGVFCSPAVGRVGVVVTTLVTTATAAIASGTRVVAFLCRRRRRIIMITQRLDKKFHKFKRYWPDACPVSVNCNNIYSVPDGNVVLPPGDFSEKVGAGEYYSTDRIVLSLRYCYCS